MSVVEQQTASRPVQGSTTPANYGSFDAFLKAFGVPLAIAAAVAIWLVETPRGLPIEGHKAPALFGSIFVFYLSEGIPLAIASLLVVPAATLTGVANHKGALEGILSSSAYLILGAFILTTTMIATRIAERITYIILGRIGSAPVRITLGVTTVNAVLAFLVRSSVAGTAGVSPVALALPAGMIIGRFPLLMFYNKPPSVIVYGTDKLRVEDFPKVGVLICAVACLLYSLCAATY